MDDMKKYLGFTPILLTADISNYKNQLNIELKQFDRGK